MLNDIWIHSNSSSSEKDPVAGIYPRGRKWPTIAIEAGYSESYEALIWDAKLLLEGSEGRIGLVIVAKLEPLKSNETNIQNRFVQVYKYDQETGRMARYSGRMVRSPLYFFLFSTTNLF